MTALTQVLHGIRVLCLWVAIAATFVMFAVVAFNIVGRAIFDATGGGVNLMIFGAIEMSQYALMISVFAAIPAMLGAGLIRVDILSKQFPPFLQAAADRLWLLLLAAFAAVLCLAFFDFAQTALERGDQTQDLRWPLWPFYAVAALECAALMVLAIGGVFGLIATPDQEET
ncbi:MAG: TRAP transporter small permease subunit [Pseudomonadota bacterium]